jgi:hypothetical protein
LTDIKDRICKKNNDDNKTGLKGGESPFDSKFDISLDEISPDEGRKVIAKLVNQRKDDDTAPQVRARQDLWRTVISVHWENGMRRGGNLSQALYRSQDRGWFIHNNQDFRLVCDLAGFNWKVVRAAFNRDYESKYG